MVGRECHQELVTGFVGGQVGADLGSVFGTGRKGPGEAFPRGGRLCA